MLKCAFRGHSALPGHLYGARRRVRILQSVPSRLEVHARSRIRALTVYLCTLCILAPDAAAQSLIAYPSVLNLKNLVDLRLPVSGLLSDNEIDVFRQMVALPRLSRLRLQPWEYGGCFDLERRVTHRPFQSNHSFEVPQESIIDHSRNCLSISTRSRPSKLSRASVRTDCSYRSRENGFAVLDVKPAASFLHEIFASVRIYTPMLKEW